uniref:Uncharacterized protein n=1 Tax=Panagrolaimus sp. JU765 TaxID=591449 RepID=A0AC34RP08_9BILA
NPKELAVELELFDKVFLQKRDVVKLQGRLLLEQLLPPPNAKTAQTITQMFLENVDRDRELRAKVNVTTNISLNRELELIAGEFIEQSLEQESRLWTLCQSAALNRSALVPGATVYVATHTLIDVRDGAKYIAQIVHSAQMLLSMVLVYGTEQRLLCMSHLIGADSLPSKDQLDGNLQFLPHLSSPDERIFIVLNRDGDFAIIKGRWNGFSRKISGDKTNRGKSGNAGVLNVELFNLLRNTVQKLQLPGPDGSTLFLIGDAQARLNGRRMHCRSIQTAEHIASIFSIGTLFVLCNPDKVRSRQDTTPVGHQCQKWPMTLACGYGRPVPSNRYLAQGQDGTVDIAPALLAMYGGFDLSVQAAPGACGSCSACASACGTGGGGGGSAGACGGCSSCGGCGACGGCGC